MQKASSPEWAALWSADLSILDGAPDVAIQTFNTLKSSPHREIALAALVSLGHYYQFVGQLDPATVAFREAYAERTACRSVAGLSHC